MTEYTIILFLPQMVISPPPRMWSDVLDLPNGDHVNAPRKSGLFDNDN